MLVSAKECTIQIVMKKWLHCLFVRFTRAEGQIQNVITYKMKKLIEQS